MAVIGYLTLATLKMFPGPDANFALTPGDSLKSYDKAPIEYRMGKLPVPKFSATEGGFGGGGGDGSDDNFIRDGKYIKMFNDIYSHVNKIGTSWKQSVVVHGKRVEIPGLDFNKDSKKDPVTIKIYDFGGDDTVLIEVDISGSGTSKIKGMMSDGKFPELEITGLSEEKAENILDVLYGNIFGKK